MPVDIKRNTVTPGPQLRYRLGADKGGAWNVYDLDTDEHRGWFVIGEKSDGRWQISTHEQLIPSRMAGEDVLAIGREWISAHDDTEDPRPR